jgi:hypothetical protein
LGQNALFKRLDRVTISEDLLADIGFYRTWVEYPYISDHVPICIQLDFPKKFKAYPFKFNGNWVEDKDFVELVKNLWNDPRFFLESSPQKKIIWKL